MKFPVPTITAKWMALLPAALGLLAALPSSAQTLTIVTTSFPPATIGQFYAVAFSASGGTLPYSWSTTGSVPPGLSVNSNGTISGYPTTTGSYNFTLRLTDAAQNVVSKSFTIVVAGGSGGSFTITTSSPLPNAAVGQSYSVTLAASGGTAPYQWAVSTLPAGLALNSQTGAISGTPTAAGTTTFTVQATDANQKTATANFSLTVNASPLSITTQSPLFAGTIGVPYSQPFSATGGKPPYTWSVPSGNTGGLTLDSATGTLHGTPAAAGTFTFVVQVTDSTGATASQSFSVAVNAPVLSIAVGAALPAGTVGVAYSQTLPVTATGGTQPYQWSIAAGGFIAPGLSLNASTLAVSGTPTAAGTFNFTVQVTDANQQTATRSLSITINPASLSISGSRQLPNGQLNAPYSASALTAVGGAPPYTWSATGLPSGLTINSSTGAITGTPTAAGSFAIAITVTDSALSTYADRFTMNINLPAAPAITISGLPASATPAQQYSLQVTIASVYPAPITGQAILAFSPDSGPTDQTVQFASGGTIANFSIPSGSTAAVSTVPLAIQTGTVSGTINVSIRLQAGGIDITPLPAPAASTQIAAAAPVILSVQVTRGSGSISLVVSGYSTAREVVQATFTFAAASGQSLQTSASSIAIPVENLFNSWFQDPANSPYGSQFVLTQPFTVQGDATAVIPQSVTLTNRVGSTSYTIQ